MKSFMFVVSSLVLSFVSNACLGFANTNALTNPLSSFSDIARNSDGSVWHMTQMEAMDYCSAQGMHLPNAKELAQLATKFGAQGVLDVEDIGGIL